MGIKRLGGVIIYGLSGCVHTCECTDETNFNMVNLISS